MLYLTALEGNCNQMIQPFEVHGGRTMELRSKTVSLILFSFKKPSINSKFAFTGKRRSSHFKPSIKKTIKCINLHVFIYDMF